MRINWDVQSQVSWKMCMSTMPVKGNQQINHCYNCEGYDECNSCPLIIPMIIFMTVGIRC